MATKTDTIVVDEATGIALRNRAAAQGISVGELVADMTAMSYIPIALSSDDIAELDRQWMAIEAGEATVPHEDVERWLQTWGTPAFKPWRDQ